MEKVHSFSTEYFNEKEFAAFLFFLQLDEEHTFYFTSGRCLPITAERASQKHLSCATAVNISHNAHGRPKNRDIQTYLNYTLDFEYRPDPAKAILVAERFLALLSEKRFCRSDLPYVISGAGVHIHIPLLPLPVANGDAFNAAVALVTKTCIEPLFQQACAEHSVHMKLECYDIARVLSAPGTYRAPKPDDHPSLANGFVRRWSVIPTERKAYESFLLRYLIVEALETVQTAQAGQTPPQNNGLTQEEEKRVKKFIHDYRRKHWFEFTHSQRHRDFAKIICALACAFDQATAIRASVYVNSIIGDGKKFLGNEAYAAKQCLRNFVHPDPEKQQFVIVTKQIDQTSVDAWSQFLVPSQGARTDLTDVYRHYTAYCQQEGLDRLSRQQFVSVLFQKGVIDRNTYKQKLNGKTRPCLINMQLLHFVPNFYSHLEEETEASQETTQQQVSRPLYHICLIQEETCAQHEHTYTFISWVIYNITIGPWNYPRAPGYSFCAHKKTTSNVKWLQYSRKENSMQQHEGDTRQPSQPNPPPNGQKVRVGMLIARTLGWALFDSWDVYLTHIIDRILPAPYPLAIWNQTHWVVIQDAGTVLRPFDPFSNLQDAYLIFQRGWPLLDKIGTQEVIHHLFPDVTVMDPETYLSRAVTWSASTISTAMYMALLVQDAEAEKQSLLAHGVTVIGETIATTAAPDEGDGAEPAPPHHLFE